MMFERFTERARRVLFFARYEASQLGSISIETEHLLLGLLREGKGLTSRIFARAHLSLESIRGEIEGRTVAREKVSTSVEIPFSAESKRVLQYAADEADRLRHNYIGTEHLLLALLREPRSIAGSILTEKGMGLESVCTDIETLLSSFHEVPQGRIAPMLDRPHIVLVQLNIRPELLVEFEGALLHNARESLAHDEGCLRFDVSQSIDDPSRWVLHEVYTNADAHAAHRQSAHFLAYNEVAERAVTDKTVMRCVGRHVGA
jgi:quinol monooxygenase YgiN